MLSPLVRYRPPRIAMTLAVAAAAFTILLPTALHQPLLLAGAVAGLAGFTLMIRAWWLFRLAGTAICPTARASVLVTHDVFAVSRNPMYLGMILMLLGSALATGGLPFYAAAMVYALIMDRVFCPYEELKSVREFGDDFVAYRRQVRRWL